ncbi:MAG: hypothetical protein SynsKO_14740 [Synoicihabitans sp.]
MTKPQDVLVALKLFLVRAEGTYAELAKELGMSASEVYAAVKRLEKARLIESGSRRVRLKALREFLNHGVPHVFPAEIGAPTRGVPTAWGAPVLKALMSGNEKDIPVWPDPNGKHRGAALDPLYRSAPRAAKNDAQLYDLLSLVDALRSGRARERNLASKELASRLTHG